MLRPAEACLLSALALAGAAGPGAAAPRAAPAAAPAVAGDRLLAVVRSSTSRSGAASPARPRPFSGSPCSSPGRWSRSASSAWSSRCRRAATARRRSLPWRATARGRRAAVARFHTLGAPWNDAYAPLQPALEELGLAAAQRLATGRGVRVAVVDTGVDFDHPDLRGRIALHRSFVPGGESDFAATSTAPRSPGCSPPAPQRRRHRRRRAGGGAARAQGLLERAARRARRGLRQLHAGARLDFALTERPRILNLSLGGPPDPLLARLLARAEERGILVVAAADPSGEAPFPASLPTVLAVAPRASARGCGALRAGRRPHLHRTAGRVRLLRRRELRGGAGRRRAALLVERRPELGPAELRRLLVAGARPGAGPPGLSACGRWASASAAPTPAPRAPEPAPGPPPTGRSRRRRCRRSPGHRFPRG